MTLEETILQKLSEWRPAEGRHVTQKFDEALLNPASSQAGFFIAGGTSPR